MKNQSNKRSPLVWCFMVILGLAASFSLVTTIRFIINVMHASAPAKYSMLCLAASYFFTMLALIFCIIYTFKGYKKENAGLYKIFIILAAISCVCALPATIIENGLNIGLIFAALRLLILLVFAFWKNLGKQRSYILFFVLLAIDIIFRIENPIFIFMIISNTARLLIDVTLGLSLRGKYTDKEKRGTT